MTSPPAVVILTGAAGGIGRAIAHELFDQDVALALNDCNAAGLAALVADLAAPMRTLSVAGDLTDPAVREQLIEASRERFGRIDGLVHAAGVSVEAVGDILEVTPAHYERCLAVNAQAGFFLMQRVGRELLATSEGPVQRFIVSITSSNATATSIDRAEYCVSKAAASMATQCFAARLAPHGINVFEIRPGVIATEMTASRLARYEERIREEQLTAVPRVGQPEDVAAWVAALALGRLPYTVGQVISVDGGLASRRY